MAESSDLSTWMVIIKKMLYLQLHLLCLNKSIGEIDINSGNGLFNFSPMIYKSNAGEFQMESRVFRYPIENLASTFFRPIKHLKAQIFAFTTNDDNLTISEFQLIY